MRNNEVNEGKMQQHKAMSSALYKDFDWQKIGKYLGVRKIIIFGNVGNGRN